MFLSFIILTNRDANQQFLHSVSEPGLQRFFRMFIDPSIYPENSEKKILVNIDLNNINSQTYIAMKDIYAGLYLCISMRDLGSSEI